MYFLIRAARGHSAQAAELKRDSIESRSKLPLSYHHASDPHFLQLVVLSASNQIHSGPGFSSLRSC